MNTKKIRELLRELTNELSGNFDELKAKELKDSTVKLYSSIVDFTEALPDEPEPEQSHEQNTESIGERLARQSDNSKAVEQQANYFEH